jgi:hemoglobin
MQSAAEVVRGGSASLIRRLVVAAAVLVGVLPTSGRVLAQEPAATPKSLYERIGKYDAIAGVVDEFLKQLQADPAFARFGQGRGQNSLMRGRQLIVDQICALSGGPCVYIGREMKQAHQGLAITQVEWEAAGKKMAVALAKFNVSEPDQKEFAAMIEKLRPDIVEAPAKPAESKPATKN